MIKEIKTVYYGAQLDNNGVVLKISYEDEDLHDTIERWESYKRHNIIKHYRIIKRTYKITTQYIDEIIEEVKE